jgi:fumarate hydratase class II
MEYRIEKDTMGEMKVPADKYWAAQTQRSVHNFEIGNEKMPLEVVYGFANLKKACALVNNDLGRLDAEKTSAIAKACETVLSGELDDNFPLVVWQTGSGTQSNMNMNEVVANKATEILGGDFTKENLVHPNDDVNKGQSSNDTYPTGMRIAEVVAVMDNLIPALNQLNLH